MKYPAIRFRNRLLRLYNARIVRRRFNLVVLIRAQSQEFQDNSLALLHFLYVIEQILGAPNRSFIGGNDDITGDFSILSRQSGIVRETPRGYGLYIGAAFNFKILKDLTGNIVKFEPYLGFRLFLFIPETVPAFLRLF